jgi:hypothetical protein
MACGDTLTKPQSVERIAQNVRAAGGKPTADGAKVLNAVSTGNYSAADSVVKWARLDSDAPANRRVLVPG